MVRNNKITGCAPIIDAVARMVLGVALCIAICVLVKDSKSLPYNEILATQKECKACADKLKQELNSVSETLKCINAQQVDDSVRTIQQRLSDLNTNILNTNVVIWCWCPCCMWKGGCK